MRIRRSRDCVCGPTIPRTPIAVAFTTSAKRPLRPRVVHPRTLCCRKSEYYWRFPEGVGNCGACVRGNRQQRELRVRPGRLDADLERNCPPESASPSSRPAESTRQATSGRWNIRPPEPWTDTSLLRSLGLASRIVGWVHVGDGEWSLAVYLHDRGAARPSIMVHLGRCLGITASA